MANITRISRICATARSCFDSQWQKVRDERGWLAAEKLVSIQLRAGIASRFELHALRDVCLSKPNARLEATAHCRSFCHASQPVLRGTRVKKGFSIRRPAKPSRAILGSALSLSTGTCCVKRRQGDVPWDAMHRTLQR